MKKKIIMGLFVLATVIGMGFAGTKYYSCGHRAGSTKGSDVYLTTLCSNCKNKQDKDYANQFRKEQDEHCSKPNVGAAEKDFYRCDEYNKSNN